MSKNVCQCSNRRRRLTIAAGAAAARGFGTTFFAGHTSRFNAAFLTAAFLTVTLPEPPLRCRPRRSTPRLSFLAEKRRHAARLAGFLPLPVVHCAVCLPAGSTPPRLPLGLHAIVPHLQAAVMACMTVLSQVHCACMRLRAPSAPPHRPLALQGTQSEVIRAI